MNRVGYQAEGMKAYEAATIDARCSAVRSTLICGVKRRFGLGGSVIFHGRHFGRGGTPSGAYSRAHFGNSEIPGSQRTWLATFCCTVCIIDTSALGHSMLIYVATCVKTKVYVYITALLCSITFTSTLARG